MHGLVEHVDAGAGAVVVVSYDICQFGYNTVMELVHSN